MAKNEKFYGVLFFLSIVFSCNMAAGTSFPDFKCSINKYDYEKYNKVTNTFSFNCDFDSFHKLDRRLFVTDSGEWEVKISRSAYPKMQGAEDVEFIFKLLKGKESDASISVSLCFEQWDKSGYVLFPAAVYNGNRFDWRRIAYSPKLNDIRDIGPQKPTIISDVPRLNIKEGPSCIQERSGSMSIPCIGTYDGKKVFLLTTEQANQWGDFGMNFEEKRNGGCEITLLSPLVRERYKYEIADNMVATPDVPANFSEGDEVKFNFRIYSKQASELQALFNHFFEIRQDYCEFEPKPMYPFSECYTTIENKFNEQNFVPEWGYYAIGMRENFLQDWQIGWTGGMITTYPLLYSQNKQTVERVISNFDWLFPAGISPSGFFWDSGEKGNRWYGGDIRRPMTANWHLIRKSGDALYYIFKQFDLMRQKEIQIKESWISGAKTVTEAFVNLYKQFGQFGQFVDSQTGEVVVGGSTSGGIVPAALAFASVYFNNPEYLSIAEQSAEKMYEEYISKGISCGGPGDAMQNPDSESWYAMLESFMVIYEQTNNEKWLRYAIETAHQFSTWVMAYDYQFPDDCLFGQLKMQTTGAVFANTQNKHGSPGICTHSGIALLRLYRATRNSAYLQLLSQISKCIPQYMSHKNRIVGGMPVGWINERISTTDWFEGIGEIPKGSTWAETAMLLSAVELPSIYVDLDRNQHYVFDHLEVQRINKNVLKITNPSAYPAKVKIYAENSTEMHQSWNNNALYHVNIINLKAGESKNVKLQKNKYLF